MRSLQAAIIGAGFMGPVHAEALRRLGVNVRGVLSSSESKSRDAAERLGVQTAYGSLEALLADAAVDVVHVTSPNYLHYEQASAALTAGKHVLCEKPLALNTEETSVLTALAAERGLAAGVNYNIRFYPLCVEARDRARAGAIGEIHSLVGSYTQDWLVKRTDYNWRVRADRAGELRAVADIGTHWLDLVLHISGLRSTKRGCDPRAKSRRSPRRARRTRSRSPSTPRTTAPCCSASRTARKDHSGCPRRRRAGRTAYGTRSQEGTGHWRGTARPRTSCGQDQGTRPTRRSRATRRS